jgi:CheY-like chemotaxis protein
VQDPEAQPAPEPAEPTRADLRHELGNRLAAIVAFSHLIRTDPRLPDDLHDQAALLGQEADRTRELVERILDAATLDGVASLASSSSASTGSAGGDSQPVAVAGARILVVDDEPAIREFLTRILTRIGYRPVTAAGGAEALAIVRSDPPDAILCDHRMGAMSGATFNDAVADVAPNLARRFAFMTGDVSNPEIRSVAESRGIPLLAKPFDIASVERTVAAILER